MLTILDFWEEFLGVIRSGETEELSWEERVGQLLSPLTFYYF